MLFCMLILYLLFKAVVPDIGYGTAGIFSVSYDRIIVLYVSKSSNGVYIHIRLRSRLICSRSWLLFAQGLKWFNLVCLVYILIVISHFLS